MFGLSMGEIALICVVALLILGPKKLPELAKGLGKGIKDFQKALKSNSEEEDINTQNTLNQNIQNHQGSPGVADNQDKEVNSKLKS